MAIARKASNNHMAHYRWGELQSRADKPATISFPAQSFKYMLSARNLKQYARAQLLRTDIFWSKKDMWRCNQVAPGQFHTKDAEKWLESVKKVRLNNFDSIAWSQTAISGRQRAIFLQKISGGAHTWNPPVKHLENSIHKRCPTSSDVGSYTWIASVWWSWRLKTDFVHQIESMELCE